tara:strand:+ start:35719 stop:36825 length:1107 start_codon:yes stop_codon:yes gene_type:complete
MKLLCMVSGNYLPSVGGYQFSTHQTLAGLVEQGVEITLICHHFEGEKDFDKNLPYKIIRKRNAGYISSIKNIFLLNILFKGGNYNEVVLMGHQCEIAFALTKSFLSFKPIILAAGTRLAFKNKKYIVKFRNFLLRRAYNNSKKLIAINDHTIKYIHKFCKTPINNFIKIPRPIDAKIWEFKNKVEHNKFTLITFCRLEKEKNVQDVLKIISNLKNGGHKFIYNIIGDGNYIGKLKEISKKLQLDEEVIFHGAKTQLEIVKLLHKSDLHILLSNSESFGRVYVEAGLVKIPSIACFGYRNSAVSEVIKNNYNGFIYKFNELDKIEKKIIDLMYDKNKLEILKNNAFIFSRSNFDSKIVSKQLLKFFNGI